jgi:hypothetical protein
MLALCLSFIKLNESSNWLSSQEIEEFIGRPMMYSVLAVVVFNFIMQVIQIIISIVRAIKERLKRSKKMKV